MPQDGGQQGINCRPLFPWFDLFCHILYHLIWTQMKKSNDQIFVFLYLSTVKKTFCSSSYFCSSNISKSSHGSFSSISISIDLDTVGLEKALDQLCVLIVLPYSVHSEEPFCSSSWFQRAPTEGFFFHWKKNIGPITCFDSFAIFCPQWRTFL